MVELTEYHEFVAISAGSLHLHSGNPCCRYQPDFPEVKLPSFQERFKHQEYAVYQYVNVLLIEWKDAIAYRQGVGRIRKDFWECEAKEEIDLLMR
jgi:hypothetical protein